MRSVFVEQFISDVNPLHQADDEPVVADLQRAPFQAFEAGGRFRDARRLHRGRRASRQAGKPEFVRPYGSDAAVRFIASATDSSTRLTTNSATPDVARRVLRFAVVAIAGQNPTMGGSAPRTLKKLNGAALTSHPG